MIRLKPNAALGGAIIIFMLCAGLVSLFWTPFDPLAIDYAKRLAAPSAQHLLGTDEFGRDVMSRLMTAASTSMRISLITLIVAVCLGTAIGVIAGYARGWTDRILMAFNDALLAFPGILLALGFLNITGANEYGIVIALGFAYTPSIARIVRGTVLSLREMDYVAAARIIGNSNIYIVARHILPNCMAPLIVLATSMFGWALLAESALSFLGLGVPPPQPTWGNMLAASRPFMSNAAWLVLFPGLCISLTLLGINLLGDALRSWLDPRMRGV
ncbi:ABC transporter permease [Ensifer adhaerens]|uniref:ABC transporter permease n=1 Tax=Ensifer adhaerens TaxID=106592 RepID=UPI001CBECF91|nr:ABC transporter permease [Ensifer adhaerens]MBZ7924907.1 ABC transporter permease [Ensifer adhaerens]UAX95879.1 ABC transporter permease [Ensifer adhaerens]UAY04779.1 ABC transporter permease [Ensifer adhaerens]UAY10210.1 ABC transporter permease [Ensifer adhaerens]